MGQGGGDAALRGGQAVQPQRPPRRPEAQLQQEADRRRQVRACQGLGRQEAVIAGVNQLMCRPLLAGVCLPDVGRV